MTRREIFVSWSGQGSLSHRLAETLHKYLPKIHEAWDPFVSSEDLIPGMNWIPSLFTQLEKSHFGILCLSPECLHNRPWVYFEAGAIAKRMDVSRVVPFLIDINPHDLPKPLSYFQAAVADYDGFSDLLKALGDACDFDHSVMEIVVDRFEVYWPRIEKEIENARSRTNLRNVPPAVSKSDRELLTDLLDYCRSLDAKVSQLHGSYEKLASQTPPPTSSPVTIITQPTATAAAPEGPAEATT